jgi:hypothetical protein
MMRWKSHLPSAPISNRGDFPADQIEKVPRNLQSNPIMISHFLPYQFSGTGGIVILAYLLHDTPYLFVCSPFSYLLITATDDNRRSQLNGWPETLRGKLYGPGRKGPHCKYTREAAFFLWPFHVLSGFDSTQRSGASMYSHYR